MNWAAGWQFAGINAARSLSSVRWVRQCAFTRGEGPVLDRAKQFALLPEMEQNTQTQMRADKREDSEWSLHEQENGVFIGSRFLL